MTDRSERAVLNRLIETCKDAQHGFQAAAEQVTSPSLRTLLFGMAAERGRFAADLLPHAQRLGGATGSGGSAAAAVHRGWSALRHSIERADVPVVKEAERGEHFGLGVYKEAIAGLLPHDVRDLVESQYAELQRTGTRLKALDHSLLKP